MFPPKPWNVWMFVCALVINRRRVDAGEHLGRPPKCHKLQGQLEREDKFVVHVTVGSIFSMVAMDPSTSAKTV